jgi:Tfp pilus assembly protein PilO
MQIDPVVWTWATLIAGALLTALVLAVGHWFPWPQKLDRISAYVYGVLSILAGFALWRLLNADWQVVVGLVIICCAGGLTVILAYRIDGWVLAIRKAQKAEATDAELAG